MDQVLKEQSSRIRAQESELRAVPSFQTLQIQRVQGDPYKFEPQDILNAIIGAEGTMARSHRLQPVDD